MVKAFHDYWSGLTHFFGILFAAAATILLLTTGGSELTVYQIVSYSIFGGGMILLYSASTLYHWLPLSDEKLLIFRRIDHIMIFVFIAASYTPICLITLKGAWGWSIFGSVWGFTIAGLILKLFWIEAPRILYTSIYLMMGWIIVIAIYPLWISISSEALTWIAVGGVFYSVGAVIYALKKPVLIPEKFGFHELFHIFILAGSFSHFIAVYYYI